MGLIEKAISILMLPLGILIILETLNIYTLILPIDKMLIGAVLMLALQIVTIIMLKIHAGEIGFTHLLTTILFILPAIAYFLTGIIGPIFGNSLPIIFGVLMFVESWYALKP